MIDTHLTLTSTMASNDQEIRDRIKYLMQELNCRQVQFAQRIDVDTSNLSKYLNGHLPISESLINRIVVNLGVSKDWLVQGTDLPFAKPQPTVLTTTPADLRPRQRMGTPVYDIDVTAGTTPRTAMFSDDQIIGRVDLPELATANCKIVRVSGDSMSPVIKNGDFIAVRELVNAQQIYWGQIYVVLLDDYRMVKYIRRHNDPAMVILRSENKAYDDMEIYRRDIRELMFVHHILHVDTRM